MEKICNICKKELFSDIYSKTCKLCGMPFSEGKGKLKNFCCPNCSKTYSMIRGS